MKKVYILPNLFTTANLFCGLLAIIHIFNGDYESACLLILISAVLDGLDGKIARLTKTQSAFGINYDSLSDLAAFGVAPSMLIYTWIKVTSPGDGFRVAAGVSILFAICGALRLARFNVITTGKPSRREKSSFRGLPIPAAACTVVASFLALWETKLYLNVEDSLILRFLPVVFIGLAWLMVSNVPYPSLKHIDIERRKPFDYLVSIIIILCIVVALWQMRIIMLLLLFWTYIFWGLGTKALRIYRKKKRKSASISSTTEEESPDSSPTQG